MSEAAKHTVDFVANPTQKAFIESRNKADLWACRMGEGKSAGLVWACFYHAQHNPGARCAIIRDTWENCRDTTQAEFLEWFPAGVMGHYVASTKTFKWGVQGIEGQVKFMGMDDEKDASSLQSLALGAFMMDEPAPAAGTGGIAKLIFTTALSRLRQKGMNWYTGKLAENNPDESHWTYSEFVDPGNPKYGFYQAVNPENLANLPQNYYQDIEEAWKDRPDLQARFAHGKFGFQKLGKDVTPEWNDSIHLVDRLKPVSDVPLVLLWDFGLNPTCIITQVTPLGSWYVLESYVGEDIGVAELIEAVVLPRLTTRFDDFGWSHIGDPAGKQREQSDSRNSAVKVIKDKLGGRWKDGPLDLKSRIESCRNVLRMQRNGVGLVQVDKRYAREVWHALRGGWHRRVSTGGVVSGDPLKNIHSHPADAFGYGAARLFPLRLTGQNKKTGKIVVPHPTYFKNSLFGSPHVRVPKDGEKMTFERYAQMRR